MFLGILASIAGMSSHTLSWIFWLILFFGFSLIFLQTFTEYHRRTHDPLLILEWQEMFDEMGKARDAAARAMIEYLSVSKHERSWSKVSKAKPEDLEDVFDLFDDLGFYIEGGQFSPEVAHHHFYNWIRIYLQEGFSYIEQNRKDNHEPKKWDHCEFLFQQVNEIEKTTNQFETDLNWSDDKLKKYLSYELAD